MYSTDYFNINSVSAGNLVLHALLPIVQETNDLITLIV